MAARKLPGPVILLMALAVSALAVAALKPVVVELRLVLQLRSPGEAEWKRAAEMLIERGGRKALARAMEAALVRDPDGFGDWQKKLFELRARDFHRALPAYEAGLRQGNAPVRKAALQALLSPEWRRPEAVPVAAGALESPDPVTRWQAGYVLHGMGPGARAAAPALIQAARDPEEHVRWAVVYALGMMAPASPEAVGALVDALGDPSALVASSAASALGGFGRRAAPAMPALIEALRRRDVVVKVEAARALGSLGRMVREALPILLEALGGDDEWRYESFGGYTLIDRYGEVLGDAPFVVDRLDPELPPDGRVHVLEAALRLGADARDVLPCLSKLIRDSSYEVRQAAVGVLGRIGPAASAAVPDLVGILPDRMPGGRRSSVVDLSETNQAAADALAAIGPAAVGALLEAIRSADPRTRCGAARALGKMDRAGLETVEALRSALEDPWFRVIVAAAKGLKRFDPDVNVVPALLAAAGKSPDVSSWGFENLDGLAGKEALSSVPSLREAVSKEAPLPWVAMSLLASIAREDVEALPDLLGALESRDDAMRQQAAAALGGLASRAEEVVLRLIRVLEHDEDRDIRLAAASSLERLGGRAESALPALWSRHASEQNQDDRARWLAIIDAISPGDPKVIELRLREPRGDWDIALALEAIVKTRATARSLLPLVEPHLEHEAIATRVKAARALWKLEPRVDLVLGIAREALSDDWSSQNWSRFFPAVSGPQWRNPAREEAARLLSEMGPAGKPATPELVACLDFPGHTVRILAAEALHRIGSEARLDVFIEAVEDSVPNLATDPARIEGFTAEALRVIGDLGSEAPGAIPSLEGLRDAAAGPLREAAAEALRKVAGPQG